MIDKESRKGPWSCGGLYSPTYNLDCSCGCENTYLPPEIVVTWRNMLRRCYYKNDPAYFYYGGRGIKVCERLKNAYCFYFLVGPRPSIVYPETGRAVYSLGRIDPNGSYSCGSCSECVSSNNPRNVEWQSSEEQCSPSHRLPRHTHTKRYPNKTELARKLGPAGRRRSKFIDRCDLDLLPAYETSPEGIRRVLKLKLRGSTLREIGEREGITHQGVIKRLNKLKPNFSIAGKLKRDLPNEKLPLLQEEPTSNDPR